MSANNTPFRIEILDANGTPIGGGPLENVIELNDTRILDSIGILEFSIPAGERKSQLIKTGVQFDIFDEVDGYLGRYSFSSKSILDRNSNAILNVKCYDALRDLAYTTVGFFRDFNNQDISDILDTLAGLRENWSAETTSEGNNTITFSGESIFRAVDELRDRRGEHFRLKQNTPVGQHVLQFGPFGDVSSLQFTQFNGQEMAAWSANTNNVAITDLDQIEESDEIWNKAIPLGFGQGVSQLTIEDATLGVYTVQSEANADGSLRYFISDSDSILKYGTREKILQFPNIRPISNSTTNTINAANALKLAAEAYMSRHLDPQFFYKMSILDLRKELNPGDKIHVKYVAERDGIKYLTLDDDFWVMKVTRNRSANGNRSQALEISNFDNNRTSDQDVIIDVVRNLNDIGVHVPATLAYAPIGPYTKRILGNATEGNRVDANFVARIQNEVLYINRALLRFKTETLKSSAAGAAHNHLMFATPTAYTGTPVTTKGTTACADSPGAGGLINPVLDFYALPTTPLYTFQSGQTGSDSIEYGIFTDEGNYPRNFSIEINGVNRDSELGGPFAVTETQVEKEIDITDILIEDGIRRNHSIVFTAADGRGEIEFELDLLVTIQPIAVE